MTKLSESIVGKIKQEHIVPAPRWQFLFKGYMFWTFFAVSVLLGSLSFSVIVHILRSGDLDIFSHLQGNLITSMMILLPYFWFLFLLLFAVIAYFNCKCTKHGYRYRRRWILLGSVALSVFLGSVFYAFGMGKIVDESMAKAMPFYDQSKHRTRNELWLQPENGLIMGKVIQTNVADSMMIIQDEQGRDWTIDEDAVLPEAKVTIKEGRIVKIIGKKKGDREFVAKEIRRCGDCHEDEDEDDDDDDDEK